MVGREKEIERVIQILARRTKNNPVLLGEPGVGKTAVAQGLALRIVNCEVPDILEDKKIKFVKEHEMTPQKYINELKGMEKYIFQKLYAGNMSKKLYKLYEFETLR